MGKRILLLGDYSNCQRTLASALRTMGHDVTLISDGSGWMNCDRDISLNRYPGKMGGLLFYLDLRFRLHPRLRDYDIVSVHDPNFLKLKPHRIRYFFDRLKEDNNTVFLNAMSTDLPFLNMLERKDSPLRYSEWFVDGMANRMRLERNREWEEWHAQELAEYQKYFYSRIDGAVATLYEYYHGLREALPPEKVHYAGMPIDTSLYTPVIYPEKIKKVKLFLGRDRNRKLLKGSDYLETAARRVVEKYPDKAELRIVENVPFNQFIDELRGAHVVLDQIYSYTPATTALMAMSMGLNVVSGGEPDYYDFIGEKENRPIINASLTIEELTDTIERIVMHPEELAERGAAGRRFVEKHNSHLTVAGRYLNSWGIK
ncbi:MAG: hypothetical protein K2N03_05425 [Muribaculaceae bacterium]|nr:hypothetical protein [Muribaculaceae bacterium]